MDKILVLLIRGVLILILGIFPNHVAWGKTELPLPDNRRLSTVNLAEFAQVVQEFINRDLAIGAEVLVLENRHVVLHETFGWNDKEGHIPMEKNTVFSIRSMTKPLTGAAAQILIDEGILRLDDRVSKYLPGFSNTESAGITINQLLTHTSGLPLTTLTQFEDYKSLYAMANAIGKKGPEYNPGSRFWYSDAGTDVLAAIIEIAAGMPIAKFIDMRIFKPLGMEDSFYLSKKNDHEDRRIASLYGGAPGSWGKFWQKGDEPFFPFPLGSQGVYCTPMDYARFLAMLMDEGRIEEYRVLSKEAVRRILTPAARMLVMGSNQPYPTGFTNLEVHHGQMLMLYTDPLAPDPSRPSVIGYGGSDGTFAWAWPESDIIVLYFTQSRSAQALSTQLELNIQSLFIDPESTLSADEAKPDYQAYVGEYIADFGQYKNSLFKVEVRRESLVLDIPGQMPYELNEPDEAGWRTFKLTNQVAVLFHRDETGTVHALKIKQITHMAKQPLNGENEINSPDKYAEIEGTYMLPMAKSVLTITYKRDRFTINDGPKEISGLKNPDPDGWWFFTKDSNKAVSFEQNQEGKIIAMKLCEIAILKKKNIRSSN